MLGNKGSRVWSTLFCDCLLHYPFKMVSNSHKRLNTNVSTTFKSVNVAQFGTHVAFADYDGTSSVSHFFQITRISAYADQTKVVCSRKISIK